MNIPVEHPNLKKVQRALDDMGGVYSIADIMEYINDGRMQSFAYNDTWVVTEIREFPRGSILVVVFVAGNLSDARIIDEELVKFCKEHGIKRMMSGSIRAGWLRAVPPGWKYALTTFVKEIEP